MGVDINVRKSVFVVKLFILNLHNKYKKLVKINNLTRLQ